MLKFNVTPVKGRLIIKVIEIANGECVIDILGRFPDKDDVRSKTEILEVGDELGLFELIGTTYTETTLE